MSNISEPPTQSSTYSTALEFLSSPSIRQIIHNNETYFHVIDIVASLRNTDYAAAMNYYHVTKTRLKKHGQELPGLINIKMLASDGKKYITEVINLEGFIYFRQWLEPRISSRVQRVERNKTDEVEVFHPLVIKYFQAMGFETQHHVVLPSRSIIDIVATQRKVELIVECKPYSSKTDFYGAIGQVLSYRAEYNPAAVPTIAIYSDYCSDYMLETCGKLKIHLYCFRPEQLDEIPEIFSY